MGEWGTGHQRGSKVSAKLVNDISQDGTESDNACVYPRMCRILPIADSDGGPGARKKMNQFLKARSESARLCTSTLLSSRNSRLVCQDSAHDSEVL